MLMLRSNFSTRINVYSRVHPTGMITLARGLSPADLASWNYRTLWHIHNEEPVYRRMNFRFAYCRQDILFKLQLKTRVSDEANN